MPAPGVGCAGRSRLSIQQQVQDRGDGVLRWVITENAAVIGERNIDVPPVIQGHAHGGIKSLIGGGVTGEECAAGGELLQTATITTIHHIDVPLAVHRYAYGILELPVSRAGTAPLAEVAAGGVEFLDTMITLIGDIDVPLGVHRYSYHHIAQKIELSVSQAATPPLAEVVAAGVEFLDTMIPLIGDIDVPLAVHCHAAWPIKLPVPRALAAPLNEVAAAGVEFLDTIEPLGAPG